METKFIVASWHHSGNVFVRDMIRENFPEWAPYDTAFRTHKIPYYIEDYLVPTTKVFFVLTDPRDVATNLPYHKDGNDIPYQIYSKKALSDFKGLRWLQENMKIIQKLLAAYEKRFNEKELMILKYEEAVFKQKEIITKIGNFIGLSPLYMDDADKYKRSIYRPIGTYQKHFSREVIEEDWTLNQTFYERFSYEKFHLYDYETPTPDPTYEELLKRNHLNHEKIRKRFPVGSSYLPQDQHNLNIV
jgi:hypothetical protein